MLLVEVLAFILGLGLLIKGADVFVEAVAVLARKAGISEFIIGLTLVAFGTSIPELGSALTASMKGEPDIVIGNIIGSNIANIGLVAGLAALFGALKPKTGVSTGDGNIMLMAMLVFLGFAFNGEIVMVEAVFLLAMYIIYTGQIFELKPRIRLMHHLRLFSKFFWGISHLEWKSDKGFGLERFKAIGQSGSETRRDILLTIGSGAAIFIGANLFIDSSIFFAEILQIPKNLIGMTIVAIGTSLPELSVSVSAARKGHGELVIGNVIGSNIANTLLIGGLAGIINPLTFPWWTKMVTAPFMIGIAAVFVIMIRSGGKIEKKHGIGLLTVYLIFIIAQFLSIS